MVIMNSIGLAPKGVKVDASQRPPAWSSVNLLGSLERISFGYTEELTAVGRKASTPRSQRNFQRPCRLLFATYSGFMLPLSVRSFEICSRELLIVLSL